MLDSGMAKRLPVLVLLGVIILITSIDWIHGFNEWPIFCLLAGLRIELCD